MVAQSERNSGGARSKTCGVFYHRPVQTDMILADMGPTYKPPFFALQLTAKREFLSEVVRDSSHTKLDKGQIKVSSEKRNTRGKPKRLPNFRLQGIKK